MSSYICGGSSFHPYECSHDNHCIHCTWGIRANHDPKQCALCQDLGFQLVKEPYAQPIRVRDYSKRKLRIFVSKVRLMPQQELPF